ncbi:MAG: flagellar hook-length control protein FliK [Pseudonocardiales bacterium]|nr:flagellar hook-length control protein FliK [Pseudonocardiales bacterium]
MALMIATAISGPVPGAALAEQSGPDCSGGPAGSPSPAGDAFAGVLAGLPESGHQAGRQRSSSDRPGDEADSDAQARASELADAAGLADLAVLALLAPALPASTAALISSGYTAATETATGESSNAGVRPVSGSDAGPVAGPAQQLAASAQPGGAEAQAQALAAQPTPSVAQAARFTGADQLPDPAGLADGLPSGKAAADGIGPVEGASAARGLGVVTGFEPSRTVDPAKAATSAAIVELTRNAQAAASSGPANSGPANSAPAKPNSAPGNPNSAPGPAALGPAAPGPTAADNALPQASTPLAAAVPPPDGAIVLPTRDLPGAHVLNHRPAPAAASSATAADRAEASASSAPAGAGFGPVAELATATAQAGNLTAAQFSSAQPLGAGQPVTPGRGPEPADRHPAADLPLARQVAGPVLAVRAGGDGSHQLIVALHPAELGPVNVHVRIEGDLMTIQLASSSETAHDTLRDALPQLRSELQSAGLSTVSLSLDLTSGGAPGSGAFADPRQAAGAPNRATPAGELSPTPLRPRTSGPRIGTHSSSGLDRWL